MLTITINHYSLIRVDQNGSTSSFALLPRKKETDRGFGLMRRSLRSEYSGKNSGSSARPRVRHVGACVWKSRWIWRKGTRRFADRKLNSWYARLLDARSVVSFSEIFGKIGRNFCNAATTSLCSLRELRAISRIARYDYRFHRPITPLFVSPRGNTADESSADIFTTVIACSRSEQHPALSLAARSGKSKFIVRRTRVAWLSGDDASRDLSIKWISGWIIRENSKRMTGY